MSENKKKNLQISEAAKFLGVSVDTLRRWEKKGKIHAERPNGKDRFFSLSDLEKLKLDENLSVSQAAEQLGLSVSTLRRLEEKDILVPKRTEANERSYSRNDIAAFLNSDYFLKQKTVQEQIINPVPETEATDESVSPHQETTHKVLGAITQHNHDQIVRLKRFLGGFLLLLVFGSIFLLLILTLLFIFLPQQTARFFNFGYRGSANAQNLAVKTQQLADSKSNIKSGPQVLGVTSAILEQPAQMAVKVARVLEPDKVKNVILPGENTGDIVNLIIGGGGDGTPGVIGKDGAQGLRGQAGIIGPVGPTGATGATGEAGATGATGAAGPAGADGTFSGSYSSASGLQLTPYGTNSGNTTDLRYYELSANGTDYVGFKAPDSVASSIIWTLPGSDGSSGQCLSTNGSGVLSFGTCGGGGSGGITSLNGLTDSVQTFEVGNSGSDFNISSSGTAHTFNIPDAASSARGLVTTSDQSFAGIKTFLSAISAPTSSNTINGLVINSGALSSVTGITFASGGINLGSGGITNAGALSGISTINSSGVVTFGNLTASRGVFTTTGGQLTTTAASQYLIDSLSDETGSGVAVFATSPTLVTPVLGVATATSINKVNITAPATGSTLTIADGKTFTVSNSLTFTGTDSTSFALPSSSGTVCTTTTCTPAGGTLFTLAATTGSSSTISQGGTATIAAGSGITATNNGSGTVTIANTGVTSLNSGTGALTLNNASTASGGTITIDDASTSQKGIASFNSNFFSTSSGAVSIAADSLDFTEFKDTMTLDADQIINQSTNTWTQNFTGTTTNGFTYNANSLTSGKALSLASTSIALTSGGLMSLDWSPASTTTATGDLFSLNIGSSGTTTGNLFAIKDSGSTILGVSETQFTTSLPSNFTSAGDVSVAYDINFTNPTASFIKSYSGITIQPGDSYSSSNLTLAPYNEGSVYIPSNVATAYGLDVDANLLSSGRAADISSSSTAGTASGASYLMYLDRSGANASTAHTAYGLFSTVTNTNATSGTNVAGYFSASGATTANYGLLVASGNVGIGDTSPASLLTVGASDAFQVNSSGNIVSIGAAAHTIQNSAGALGIDSATTGAISIGTGANAKTITIGNATGATALAFNSGTGSQTYTSQVVSGTTTSSAFVFTDNTTLTGTQMYVGSTGVTTGTLLNVDTGAANTLTSGKLLSLTSTSTGLTGSSTTGSFINSSFTPGVQSTGFTGNLNYFDYSPTSAATTGATGDLMRLHLGTNTANFSGNFFNLVDDTSSVFSVSKTAFTTSLPSNFTAAGDVAIAYDINFTNPTASYIKSAAPLNIYAGETFNSSNLNLGTYNQGSIVFDTANTTTTALDFTNNTLTTGTGLNMTLGALTTGTGLSIATANNTLTTGTLLRIASSSTAQTSDSLLSVAQTGATTGITGTTVAFSTSATTNSSAKLLSLTADAMTTGTIQNISGNALTSGKALTIASSGIAFTGNLIDVTQSGSNAANTGSLIMLTNSGTASTNTAFYIKHYATGTNNLAMRVDDVSGDTSPFVIDGAGNVGVGQSAPSVLLHVGDTSVTDATNLIRLQDADSTCNFNANTGAPTCGSDITLKKDISSLDTDDLLTRVTNLRPVSYHWKTDNASSSLKFGFVAQEVATQFPELVTDETWIDGSTRKFLNIGGLMPYVIGAMKAQQLQIDELTVNNKGQLASKTANSQAEITTLGSDFVIKTKTGAQAFKIDTSGNVSIPGTLTVGKLVAGEIEGLEIISDQIKNLESRIKSQESRESTASALIAEAQNRSQVLSESVASTSASISTLSQRINDLLSGFETASSSAIETPEASSSMKLAEIFATEGVATVSGKLEADSLHIKNSALIESVLNVVETITSSRLIVTDMAEFIGKVLFKDTVEFAGRVIFNNDSAGILIIKRGEDLAEVKFSSPFEEELPVVTGSLSAPELERKPQETEKDRLIRQETLEKQIFNGEYKYLVTRRNKAGFTVKLNKPAAEDLEFSWNMVAIKKVSSR